MLENLAYLHYSCIYEQGEKGSEICLEPPKAWVVPLAICACLGSSQTAEAAPLLQYGDTGTAVVILQNQLKQANCLPQDATSDGNYDENTRAAVANLQLQSSLPMMGLLAHKPMPP